MTLNAKSNFLVIIWVIVLIYIANPLLAIVSGALLTVYFNRELYAGSSASGQFFLKTAVVLIGFNLDALDMWVLSKSYLPIIFIFVIGVTITGLLLGKLFKVGSVMSRLITMGTAICGGTAIITLAPIMKARADQVALALAVIFALNMLALIGFPIIGHYFQMSDLQFGVWSALSIHDTSSVVATASVYSDEAARVAATVKLGRTLWLIPIAFLFSLKYKDDSSRLRFPMFILFFILASVLGTLLQNFIPGSLYEANKVLSKGLLVLALFFIGTECTRATLKSIRPPYIYQALVLWVAVIIVTLMFSLSL
jgi:uncharacterized integral membrane protein (TIGR00698 family)